MKQTKHTPGPWDLSRHHYPYRDIVQRTGKDDNDAFPGSRLICRVNSDNPDYKANAHLIAAAPELLEACKYSLKRYEISDTEWARAVCAKCRVAIAKAEGR